MLEDDILNSMEEKKEKESSNEIIELSDEEDTNVFDLESNNKEEVKDKKPPKKKVKKSLTKKQRTIILIVGISILVIALGILLYFLVFKKNPDEKENTPEKPNVVVNETNYSYVDGKLVFKDINKATLGEYTCQNKDDDLCYVAYYSNEDDFDTTEYVYENGLKVNTRSDILKNRYVLIYDNPSTSAQKIILYDITDKKELGTYKLGKKLNDSSFILKNEEDLYGVVGFNDSYQTILGFDYSFIGYIPNTEAIIIKENDSSFLADFKGNKLTEAIEGDIKAFDSKYISVKVDNNRYLYDYTSTRVNDTDYDYLSFLDNYVIGIINRKLMIYDTDLKPIHQNEFKLSSSKYNPIVTYNENNIEIKREQPYTISLSDDLMEIEYIDNKKESQRVSINLYEGKFSSKLSYISYFDGTLYFYKDENKTTLLGTYPCNNPNKVNEDTTILTSCFLALETNIVSKDKDVNTGYLPIYNNRYVFVQDGDVINFWDLNQSDTSKARKATYTEVDALEYNDESMVNFETAKDNIVVAKNTSGLYGAIKVSSSGLEREIDFENKAITKVGDQFLAQKEDSATLYNPKTGNKITNITDYNNSYVVARNNNNVTIYSSAGKIIVTPGTLIYAKLYDKFFVGIDEYKRINVYKYDGTIAPGSYGYTAYVDDYANSYSIEEDGNNIKVNILDSNKNTITSYNVTIY